MGMRVKACISERERESEVLSCRERESEEWGRNRDRHIDRGIGGEKVIEKESEKERERE